MNLLRLLFAFAAAGIASCQAPAPSPKPRAYPRVEWPEKGFATYDDPACPFTFAYPAYGEVVRKDDPCWFDIAMPALHASLHCSYIPVKDRAEFDELVRDAFIIASKINERANYMEEIPYRNSHGAGGLVLRWTGPAASPFHFILTDTTTHFLRASLYFDARAEPDSLAPVVDFILADMDSLLATFAWRK